MPQSLLDYKGTYEEKGFVCSSLYRTTFPQDIINNLILQKQILSEQDLMIGVSYSV